MIRPFHWTNVPLGLWEGSEMFDEFGINAGYVEELHARYQQSPQSVDPAWREFFEGRNGNGVIARAPAIAKTNGNGAAYVAPRADGESLLAAAAMQGRVYQLLNAYRVRGHLFADVDPLGSPPDAAPELDLANFGLTADDLDRTFATAGMHGLPDRATLRQIIAHLSETYCGSIGVEYVHLEEPEPRQWLEEKMEASQNHAKLDRGELVRILTKLTDAEIFEQCIHKNYLGAKG